MKRSLVGIITTILTLGGYGGYSYLNMSNLASDNLNIKIIEFSASPPRAYLELSCSINNPFPISISLDIDVDLYMNDRFVDTLRLKEDIEGNAETVIVLPVHINSTVMEANAEGFEMEFKIVGDLTFSTVLLDSVPLSISHKIS